MNAYRKPAIRDNGLKHHLNTTAEKHDGYTYHDFVKMINKGVNKEDLARIFNVSSHTIDNWIIIYEEENEDQDSRTPVN